MIETSKLYRVKVETEIMVLAENEKLAVEIAKKNASNEVALYGVGSAYPVINVSEVPEDWKSIIPYSNNPNETRKCFEIAANIRREPPKEDIEVIMKAKEGSKTAVVEEIRPETRPDPTPKELDWHDTKSGRPMKTLRFVR